jgi:hypothetical protein
MMIPTRPRTWAVLAITTLLTAGVLTGTAFSAPSLLPALLKIKAGTANFCLDPAAQSNLGAIGLSAGAPAQLITTAPQPCVTTHVTEGAVTLGLTDGDFPFHGTITFTRAADQAKITFSEIKVTFGVLGSATAVVDGDAAHPITLLTFTAPLTSIMTDGRYLIAHDVPLNLTADGAAAFAKAFGTSPVAGGKPLFIGTGYGQLEALR